MIFLDTNVVSETIRLKPDPVVMAWLENNRENTNISTIVLAEISAGVERIKPELRAQRLDGFLTKTQSQYSGRIHAFDEQSALIYGEIIGQAHFSGRTIKTADAMIAAITLRHKATLATRNVMDFDFLKMKVVNPWG